MVIHSLFFLGQSGGGFPCKVEEEKETKYEGKETVAGSIELLSRVQELEDELKVSERKRFDLIHGNTALQIKLKASHEEEGRLLQEITSLEERQLTLLRTQVRKMVGLRH